MANVTNVIELERLKTLHNGEKQPLTFSDAEFERRLAGLRSIMSQKELGDLDELSEHQVLLGLPLHILRSLLRAGRDATGIHIGDCQY